MELENEIDILMEIIKNENLSIIQELVDWFNNYLSGLKSNFDKESISIKLESLTEVKSMFATKLKEHDEKLIEQGVEQGIEQGIEETAVKMLEADADISFISKITGLSREKLIEMKGKIGK